MKYIVILFLVALATRVDTQVNASIQLKLMNPESKAQDQFCYILELKLEEEQKVFLASQNYRLFYNASEMKYRPDLSSLILSEENYDLRIVQDLTGIDASGVGVLPFESNLGFINATIVLMGSSHTGTSLRGPDIPVEIGQFCFEPIKPKAEPKIVFARKNYTSAYGRAYSEISIFNLDQNVSTLNITHYGDVK